MFLTFQFPAPKQGVQRESKLFFSINSDNNDTVVIEEFAPSANGSSCVYRRELTADQARELKTFLAAKNY